MADGTGATGPDRDRARPEPPAASGSLARRGGASRLLHRVLGYAALVLAAAGVVLPLLPTTPFLLVAAWAFARSDPHLLARLHRSRRFGPLLRDWQAERAIPTRAKAAAVTMMAVSWTIAATVATGPLVPALLGVTLTAVALYIVTRPAPKRARVPKGVPAPKGAPAPRAVPPPVEGSRPGPGGPADEGRP